MGASGSWDLYYTCLRVKVTGGGIDRPNYTQQTPICIAGSTTYHEYQGDLAIEPVSQSLLATYIKTPRTGMPTYAVIARQGAMRLDTTALWGAMDINVSNPSDSALYKETPKIDVGYINYSTASPDLFENRIGVVWSQAEAATETGKFNYQIYYAWASASTPATINRTKITSSTDYNDGSLYWQQKNFLPTIDMPAKSSLCNQDQSNNTYSNHQAVICYNRCDVHQLPSGPEYYEFRILGCRSPDLGTENLLYGHDDHYHPVGGDNDQAYAPDVACYQMTNYDNDGTQWFGMAFYRPTGMFVPAPLKTSGDIIWLSGRFRRKC